MLFRSLRFRLTLWYALTLAVIVTASGVFWHSLLARNLLTQTDDHLRLIAQHTAFSLSAVQPLTCPELDEIVSHHQWREFIQVLGDDGAVVCRTENLEDRQLPLDTAARDHARQGAAYFQTKEDLFSTPLRLLTFPVPQEDGPAAIVQVAGSLLPQQQTMNRFRLVFLIYGPLVLFALCLGGWYLAGRALSPMVRMARAARQINADNLNLRLPVEHTGDEIAYLAETFNAMLGRLEESFRKVKQFSGDASHELRTPLAILRGETEVSLRWAKNVEDYQRTLISNLEEINRMGRIIDDLLTLAKSDAGELPLEIKEISLSDLLQELYMDGNTLGEAKEIRVFLHMKVAEEIRIRGDELRLRQMFLNLIANALKYTPEQGQVDITLSMKEGFACVSIADTGIGIPPEHLPHIFDRFYRIDKARNRADGGTGLGLAITKGIIEAHAGTIEVQSAVQQGSTFTVRLPVSGPEKNRHPKTPS